MTKLFNYLFSDFSSLVFVYVINFEIQGFPVYVPSSPLHTPYIYILHIHILFCSNIELSMVKIKNNFFYYLYVL